MKKYILVLPPPKFDVVVYSAEELAEYLLPHRSCGIKRIIKELQDKGLVTFGSTFFLSFMDKWNRKIDNPFLPTLVVSGGRQVEIRATDIIKLNKKQQNSLSFAGDAVDDAVKALKECRKRKCIANGDIDDPHYSPSFKSKKRYENASFVVDPNVSEIKRNSTRATIENRDIIAHSEMSLMTHICVHIIRLFQPGPWIDKPTNMPEHLKLSYNIACDVYKTEVHPFSLEDLFNFDCTGRFQSEGRQLASKSNQTYKVSYFLY